MAPRQTETTIAQQTSVTHRISIGLISLSLGLISLALGTALYLSPSAGFLFLPAVTSPLVTASSATAVTLTWTAPGDNGNVGQATSYDIRYSTTPITADNFTSATAVTNLPLPQPAGSSESYTVNGLQPATTYFFALTATDAAGNVSAMSNVASKTTDALPRACVPNWLCSDWTACLNSQQTKTCTDTNGCNTDLGKPTTGQVCTMPPAPAPDTGGAPAHVQKHILVASIAPGGGPAVRVIDPVSGKATAQFNAMAANDRKGVNVAAGDVNGDHQADVIVGSGAGDDPIVKVFTTSGKLQWSFNPYPTDKRIGVDVASGDIDGDGIDEILTVPAKSSALLKIWKFNPAKKQFAVLTQMYAYDRSSSQGFTVAAGDMNLDGQAEIAVTARANARSITILQYIKKQLKIVRRFNPFPVLFKTGLTITMGDMYGTGRANIIVTPGPTYYSHLKIFDFSGRELGSFLPTAQSYRGGLDLTALDVDQNGRQEIITTTYQNGDPGVRVYSYNGLNKTFTVKHSFLAFPRLIQNGLRLGSI